MLETPLGHVEAVAYDFKSESILTSGEPTSLKPSLDRLPPRSRPW